MKNNYDIIIIGAGPAGSSAAYFSKFLDKNNSKKVLLIESLNKEKFSKYHHMCGEAVSKFIEKDFPEINISKFVKNKIENITEFYGDKIIIQSRHSGYILDRPKFLSNIIDQFKKQGGEYVEDRVITFNEEKEIIKLYLRNGGSYKTKYLIVATGPNKYKKDSPYIIGDNYNSILYQILVKNYSIDKNCIEFYYDERYKDNYKWIFPYGNCVKIGVPYKNRGELKKYSKYEIIRKDIRSVSCGILENYYSNNILFIGDVAFQNNPLTKGGIRNAINAGKMAAISILHYEKPSKYDSMWKNSAFFTKSYLDASRTLSKMDNKELIYHSKPFKYFPLSLPLLLTKYRRYMPLYKKYLSSGKYGW